MCVKLVINKNYTEMHGQRNVKFFRIKFEGLINVSAIV